MKKDKIKLKISKDDDVVGYLYLPKHPKKIVHGIVKKTIPLADIISDYKGIPIYLDFDEENELIGIEICG